MTGESHIKTGADIANEITVIEAHFSPNQHSSKEHAAACVKLWVSLSWLKEHQEDIITKLKLMSDLVVDAERETANLGYIQHLGELRLQIKELRTTVLSLLVKK